MQRLKIGIIGDYNFSFNAHHATNLSLEHAASFLELEINYYWIRVHEIAQSKIAYFDRYDAFWIAPGPYLNPFFLNGIFSRLSVLKKPVLITGEGFKTFLEYLVLKNDFNVTGEKLISDNLVSGPYFENIQITPRSSSFKKLYDHFSNQELTAYRYSLYPNLLLDLMAEHIDVEAVNQFDDMEAFSLKSHEFFLVTSYYPQVTSTRDLPHPIIYTFLKSIQRYSNSDQILV